MLKTTAIVAVTLIATLAQADAAMSYRYFEPYTLVGLIFLALSCPAALLVRRLEKRDAAHG